MAGPERRQRILVVDDEPTISELLADYLSTQFDTAIAENGAEAIDRVSDEPFDLVIMDIRMPGLSGLDALQAIRERKPDQQVIMLTAVSGKESAARSLELGALDYVTKPFQLRDLMEKIRKALS